MTSEVCTSPTQPGAGEQKWRTRQHAACCTLFSHPETVPSPLCQALYSRIPVESVGWWCIFKTLGCYETLSRVTETDKYFPEAILQRTWEWKDCFFFCFPRTLCQSLYGLRVRTRFGQVCGHDAGKQKYILLQTYTHNSDISSKSTTQAPFFSGLVTFPVVIPTVLFVRLHFPLGQHCLWGLSCNHTWFQHGLK